MISAKNSITSLNGLVLAGGKSKRMGSAKDLMQWHGKAQRYHAADLLSGFCAETFISCRPEQEKDIENGYRSLPDSFLDMGPFGGILSALRSQRNSAWLVVACDLPLLNEATLRFLVANRDAKKIATTYQSPHDGLPEPLVTIWEPDSYPALLHFLGKGNTCPRKVLMNNDVLVLHAPQPEALMNVNTPEEAATAKQLLINKPHSHQILNG